jgi:hypothetical protein
MDGKTNNTGTLTLATGGATTTTLNDRRIGGDSVILFAPSSAAAFADVMPYGAFQSVVDQTIAAANTAYAMTFNTTDLSVGVSRSTPTSRILIANAGVYNIQFSAQLHKTAGAVGNIYIWLRVNGSDVAQSAGKTAVQGSTAELIAAWNYVTSFTAGQYFELMWSADDTRCQLVAIAASSPVPAIPSVILTVTQVNNI